MLGRVGEREKRRSQSRADSESRAQSRAEPMGAQKVRWTEDEEAALKKGVDKHGVGRWKYIKLDLEFKDILENRSNGEILIFSLFPVRVVVPGSC